MNYEYHYQRFLKSFNQIKSESDDEHRARNIAMRVYVGVTNSILQANYTNESEKITELNGLNEAFNSSFTA